VRTNQWHKRLLSPSPNRFYPSSSIPFDPTVQVQSSPFGFLQVNLLNSETAGGPFPHASKSPQQLKFKSTFCEGLAVLSSMASLLLCRSAAARKSDFQLADRFQASEMKLNWTGAGIY
jgi:hypothetical protein